MSSAATPRLVLRHARLARKQAPRRHASTQEAASNAASAAKETTSNVQSKASEGLSKVSSSAGPAVSGISERVSSAVGRVGGRTGRLIGFVQSLIPPTVYYSKVGFELTKIVFRGQKMSPPDVATFSRFYQPIIHAIRNPSAALKGANSPSNNPQQLFDRIRTMNTQQMVAVGVVGAEVLGFFTVGEMIGRMKLVGYRGDTHH